MATNYFDTENESSNVFGGTTQNQVNIQAGQNNPNLIEVSISDDRTPIIILFGPPACGKTMIMIRLARYLNKLGYQVRPAGDFRPEYDKTYKELSDKDNFLNFINNGFAAGSTDRISFMLLKVVNKKKETVCQILEAPGEHYHDPQHPNAPFPNYIHKIINTVNPKTWIIINELNWVDTNKRLAYVNKIQELKRHIGKRDSAIFVCNKVDRTTLVEARDNVNKSEAMRTFGQQYPGIFEPFTRSGLFFKKNDYEFVPFSTGVFSKTDSGLTFVEGDDMYPNLLWNTLKKWYRL